MARSQPSPNDGPGQSLRTQASGAMSRPSGLPSRRAQASPLLLPCYSVDGATPPIKENGQAEPTRPRRVGRWKVRRRRTLASGVDVLPTGGGDRQIADCSAVNPRYRLSVSVGSSSRYLRDLRDLRANCDGARPSCLRVFVFAMSVFLLCVSVPLWFNTLAGGLGNGTGQGIMSAVKGDIS